MPRAAATLGLEFIEADIENGTLAFAATEDFTNPAGNVRSSGDTFALGSDGRRLVPGAPRPPVRLVGDAGACPGAPPIEAAPDGENPRHRIVRAAVLLQR